MSRRLGKDGRPLLPLPPPAEAVYSSKSDLLISSTCDIRFGGFMIRELPLLCVLGLRDWFGPACTPSFEAAEEATSRGYSS